MSPRGVAPVKASTSPPQGAGAVQLAIIAGNETRRKTRPTSAGLKRFCPSPPKVILAMPIATIEPITITHQGAAAGRLRASRRPVTAAEQSQIVILLLSRNFSIRYSTKMQERTPTTTSFMAERP